MNKQSNLMKIVCNETTEDMQPTLNRWRQQRRMMQAQYTIIRTRILQYVECFDIVMWR